MEAAKQQHKGLPERIQVELYISKNHPELKDAILEQLDFRKKDTRIDAAVDKAAARHRRASAAFDKAAENLETHAATHQGGPGGGRPGGL